MSPDTLENLFYVVLSLVFMFVVLRGWMQGGMRMLMSVLAVGLGYAAGYYGGKLVSPLFSFLHYPNPVTEVVAGAAFGLFIFIVLSIVSWIVFKRTSHQTVTMIRLAYGISGALLGVVMGLFMVYLLVEGSLVLGSIAQGQSKPTDKEKAAEKAPDKAGKPAKSKEVPAAISFLADLKTGLDDGASGEFIRKYDPMPGYFVTTLGKLSNMMSHEESVDRFLEYPSVEKMSRSAKVAAIREDGEVMAMLKNSDYLGLMKNAKIRDLINDPEFGKLLKEMEFDKALDNAVETKKEPEAEAPK